VDGAGGADVTAKVQEMVSGGQTDIPATNALFGDPTPQHYKRLRVVYTLGGKRIERTVDENETLFLGGAINDTVPPEYEVIGRGDGAALRAWTAGTYEAKTTEGKTMRITAEAPKSFTLSNAWTLRFPPNLGAPPQVTLAKLISWTEHTDPGVRY